MIRNQRIFRESSWKSITIISENLNGFDDWLSDICDPHFDILVVGGDSLTDISGMFQNVSIRTINFRGFRAKKLENINRLFYNATVSYADLSGLNVSSVISAREAFCNSRINKLQLGQFNSSEQIDMYHAFEGFESERLNLSSLANKIYNTKGILNESSVKILELGDLCLNEDKSVLLGIVNQPDLETDAIIQQLEETVKSHGTQRTVVTSGVYTFQYGKTLVVAISSEFNNLCDSIDINDQLCDVIVMGGDSVEGLPNLFRGIVAHSVEFINFRAAKLEIIQSMFEDAKLEYLDLSGLSSLHLDHVKASSAFRGATILRLNLGTNWNIDRIDMSRAFEGFCTDNLDLSVLAGRLSGSDDMLCKCNTKSLEVGDLCLDKLDYKGCHVRNREIDIYLETTYKSESKTEYAQYVNSVIDKLSGNVKRIDSHRSIFSGIIGQNSLPTDTVIKQLLQESTTLGATIVQVCDGCYFVQYDKDIVIAFSSDFKYEQQKELKLLQDKLQQTECNIAVFGGDSLDNMVGLFENVRARTVELKYLRATNVWSIDSMFSGCSLGHLDLGHLNVTSLETAEELFRSAKIVNLNLGEFDVLNKVDMNFAFDNFRTVRLDLSCLEGKLYSAEYLVEGCKAESINLGKLRDICSDYLGKYIIESPKEWWRRY